MEKFSKKTLLNYVNGAGLFGAPAASSTVKFQYTTNLATAATNDTAGALTFAADGNGNAGIWAQGTLVSSAIQKVEAAAATGNKHGGKTITVTYIVANTGAVATSTFDVIDEAGLEAYFANSKTITLDTSTFEVKIKADGGLAVDNNDGLYVDIEDLFDVDGKTIDFDSQKKLKTIVKLAYAQSGLANKPAIQLQTVDSSALSEVTVDQLIADGIVESTSYDPTTNILTITWKGGAKTEIDMAAIIDIDDVFIATDSSNLLTATNDTSVVKIGTTAKLRNAVALAESAVQGISEGTSVENYVDLTIAAGNASTYAISIDDSDLKTKILEIDASIDALQAKDEEIDASIDALQAKDVEIDASIDRLDASVSALESALAGLDATESDNVLDGSIAITVTQADGLITGVNLDATKSTVTYTAKVGDTPANLTGTVGLVTGDAIAAIKDYVDAKSSALDSSVTGQDAGGFVTVNTVQEDGALSAENVTVVYGDYDKEDQTNGIATTGTTKTYVDTEIEAAINALDTSVNDSDVSNFVSVKVVEENGLLTSDEVTVQYADVTAAPGAITVNTNGIVKGDVLESAIEGALTWTILS